MSSSYDWQVNDLFGFKIDANYYYWGLGEDTPENTFPRQFMLRVAADLEPIPNLGLVIC